MKKTVLALLAVACSVALADPWPTTPVVGYTWLNVNNTDLGTFQLPTVQPSGAAVGTEYQLLSQGGVTTFLLSCDRMAFGYQDHTAYAIANHHSGNKPNNPDATVLFDFVSGGNHYFKTEVPRWFDIADVNPTMTTNKLATASIIHKGGTWDMNGGYMMFGYANVNNTYRKGYYEVNDGCVMQGMNYLFLTSQMSDGLVVITNRSKLIVESGNNPYVYGFRPGKYNETNTTVIISGGSEFRLGNNCAFHSDGINSSNRCRTDMDYNCNLIVSGEGTKMTVDGGFYLNKDLHGIHMRICDGAVLDCSNYAYMGMSANMTNNLFVIDNHATAYFRKYFFLGHTLGADHNTVLVNNGSTLDTEKTEFHVCQDSSYNRLIVSNSTFKTLALTMGTVNTSKSTHTRGGEAWFCGPDTVFAPNNTSMSPFYYTEDAKIVFDDCTIDHTGVEWRLCSTNWNWKGHQFTIRNGATLKCNSFKLGCPGSEWEKKAYGRSLPYNGSRVDVENSTLHVVSQIMQSGADSEFCLSNATLYIEGQYALYWGYADKTYTEHAISNNTFRIKGANSRMRCSTDGAQVQFNNANIVFEFLDGEKPFSSAPIQGGKLEVYDTNKIRFEGIPVIQRSLEKSVEVPLIEQSGTGWFVLSDELISETNANLEGGCYVYKSGTILYLHLAAAPGMRVIVR